MDAAQRWAGRLALPAIGIGYVVFWMLAEAGRVPSGGVQGLGWLTIIVVAFGAAIGISGRFPRSATVLASATLAVVTFVPVFSLSYTSWPIQLATLLVCAVAAQDWRARWWAAAFGVLAVLLMDVGLITAGVFFPSDAVRFIDGVGVVEIDRSGLELLSIRAICEVVVSQPGMWILLGMMVAWLIGAGVGTLRRRAQQRVAAAARAAELRAAERELAASLEHERIAREIHDVVAHSLASIVAQADGARFLGEHGGDGGSAGLGDERAALATIAERGRESLVEVRRLLDALESGDADLNPGIEALPELIGGVEAAGLSVQVVVDGEPGSLAPTQRRAAYRIAQECLTNALRHGAAGGTTRLHLEWRGPGLAVEVVSPRGDSNAGEPGRGIAGMQERARLAGGWLSVDPDDDRGFAVTAFLPYPGDGVEPDAVTIGSSGEPTAAGQ